MAPFIYESDDYYDDSDDIDGTHGRQADLEDSNFYYHPPQHQDEEAGSDISDFWTTPIVDKSGKEIGRKKMSSASWHRKDEKVVTTSSSQLKKSSSFLQKLSRLGRHGDSDRDPLLEGDELAESVQLQELHRTTTRMQTYSPSRRDRQRVAAELRQKVESGQAGRDFSRVSVYRPVTSTYSAL